MGCVLRPEERAAMQAYINERYGTNGIHLLRTLCPDDPPEAAELLDYFDSTYISGRL